MNPDRTEIVATLQGEIQDAVHSCWDHDVVVDSSVTQRRLEEFVPENHVVGPVITVRQRVDYRGETELGIMKYKSWRRKKKTPMI